MELYLEREFLDSFYEGFNNTPIEIIVRDIIINYGNKQVFINYKDDEFNTLRAENEFFALIGNTTVPIPIKSINEHLFKKSNFEQTIIFTNEKHDWFEKAFNLGALCFSLNNYRKRIKSIQETLHFKIDLSLPFTNWNCIDYSEISFNKIHITDGYILKEKNYNGLVILLKLILKDKSQIGNITLLIKELLGKDSVPKKIKEKAKKIHKNLNSTFSKQNLKFQMYISNLTSEFDLHDRLIMTNFSILESSKGFNLINAKCSNSQLISETIFDKYTYDRLGRLIDENSKYIEKLEGTNYDSSLFYKYP